MRQLHHVSVATATSGRATAGTCSSRRARLSSRLWLTLAIGGVGLLLISLPRRLPLPNLRADHARCVADGAEQVVGHLICLPLLIIRLA